MNKKRELIEEKQRVVDLDRDYFEIDDNRFKFLGKGGYSRVYFDKMDKLVVKMIKANKVASNYTLNSMIEEIVKGTYYKLIWTDLGIVLSCEYDMKKK